jgi:hypothetical protein
MKSDATLLSPFAGTVAMPSCDGVPPELLVEFHRAPDGDPVLQWIAFPPMDTVSPTATRHARRGLLVEFEYSGIWFFRTPLSHQWTRRNLERVSVVCADFAREPYGELAPVSDRLVEILDTVLELHVPNFGTDGPDLWKPRAFAVERVLGSALPAAAEMAAPPHATSLSTQVDELERAATLELTAAVNAFLGGLDPGIARWARSRGSLCARRYNLLRSGGSAAGNRRLQFADAFPLLIEGLLADKPPTGNPGKLLQAIDRGEPAVPFVAKSYGVRKHTVRHVIERPLEEMGEHWASDPVRLLALLDAMEPEARPTGLPAWQMMNGFVRASAKALGRRAPPSVLAFWLRSHKRRVKDECAHEHAAIGDLDGQAGFVREFLSALTGCLSLRAAIDGAREPSETIGVARALAEPVVTRLSWRAAVELATCWRQALQLCRTEYSDRCARLLGQRYDALLPSAVVLENRTLVPLVTPAELSAEGDALGHCVGQYGASCLRGDSYIVSLRLTGDGTRLSTAEFCVDMDRPGPVRVRLVQHHAICDSIPGQTCAAAVRTLMAKFGAPDMQAHLRRLVLERTQRNRLNVDAAKRLADILPTEAAFRRVLRPKGSYERLLERLPSMGIPSTAATSVPCAPANLAVAL